MSKFHLLMAGCVLTFIASAQTQVNLSRESKIADLSNVGPTKPMQTGTVLPAVCTTGQMFFLTTATPGSNVYGCAATNIWTVIGGSTSLNGGAGVVLTQGGGATTVSVDPAVFPTKTVVQATTSNIVTLTSTSASVLTGTQNPTLAAYGDKQLIELTWNLACAGGPMTLAIDGLAATSLVEANGSSTLSTADCPSGATNLFTYDGTLGKFKLIAGGAQANAAPPYLQFGGNSFLDYGFRATLPPASGWTAVNFGTSTFNTSGANGAISIDAQGGGGVVNLRAQTRAISGTSTLIAVVDGEGPLNGSENSCMVGMYNSSNSNIYAIGQWWSSTSGYVEEAQYNSATSKSFDGNQAMGARGPVFIRLVYSGGIATASYSVNGYKWVQLNSRSLSGYDNWALVADNETSPGAGQGGVTCNIYSWSAQ